MTPKFVAFTKACRPNVVLVLDGAYAEFVEDPTYSDGLDLARGEAECRGHPDLLETPRSGRLRVGWAYAPEAISDAVNRIRPPFQHLNRGSGRGRGRLGRRGLPGGGPGPRRSLASLADTAARRPWPRGHAVRGELPPRGVRRRQCPTLRSRGLPRAVAVSSFAAWLAMACQTTCASRSGLKITTGPSWTRWRPS